MRDRIFGLETEYGCLAPERDGFVSPDAISVKVKDHIFFCGSNRGLWISTIAGETNPRAMGVFS